MLPQDVNYRRLLLLGYKLFRNCSRRLAAKDSELQDRVSYLKNELNIETSIPELIQLCAMNTHPSSANKFSILMKLDDRALAEVEELSKVMFNKKGAISDDIIDYIIAPFLTSTENTTDVVPFEEINLETVFVPEGRTLKSYIQESVRHQTARYVVPEDKKENIVYVFTNTLYASKYIYQYCKQEALKTYSLKHKPAEKKDSIIKLNLVKPFIVSHIGELDPVSDISLQVWLAIADLIRFFLAPYRVDFVNIDWFLNHRSIRAYVKNIVLQMYNEWIGNHLSYEEVDGRELAKQISNQYDKLTLK